MLLRSFATQITNDETTEGPPLNFELSFSNNATKIKKIDFQIVSLLNSDNRYSITDALVPVDGIMNSEGYTDTINVKVNDVALQISFDEELILQGNTRNILSIKPTLKNSNIKLLQW